MDGQPATPLSRPGAVDTRMTTIRPATVADRAKLADSLASAFADDPLFNWMAGTGPDKPLGPKVRALSAIEKVHPKEEHYYLEALGTRQDLQSKGVGSAVIGHMLARCDAEGMPAYLESSNLRNVPFYARHGFEPTGEIVCGKGAPTVTAMWRDPR